MSALMGIKESPLWSLSLLLSKAHFVFLLQVIIPGLKLTINKSILVSPWVDKE